jgi:hypothetical protein
MSSSSGTKRPAESDARRRKPNKGGGLEYSRPLPHRSTPKSHSSQRQPGLIELQRYDPRYPGLLLQPDSRPISQEQLASEVKSIYAGLTMVETKCIHVDRAQAAAAQAEPHHTLASDHWKALIALHRTLLHEHHDFFLASQHPSASPALRRLAAKYSMYTRTGVARSLYSKSRDRILTVGRVDHHLATFTRPNTQRWWQSIREEVGRTIGRLEKELQGLPNRYSHSAYHVKILLINTRLFRIVSISLKSHNTVVATCLFATRMSFASAASDLKPDRTPEKTRTPIFKLETPFDYTVLGLMVLYLMFVFFLRVATRYHAKAFHASYALTVAMGALSFVINRDEFADSIHMTYVHPIDYHCLRSNTCSVFATWFTAALHTGAQYCYDNYNPALYVHWLQNLHDYP